MTFRSSLVAQQVKDHGCYCCGSGGCLAQVRFLAWELLYAMGVAHTHKKFQIHKRRKERE